LPLGVTNADLVVPFTWTDLVQIAAVLFAHAVCAAAAPPLVAVLVAPLP
jgi:hypothetical protein